MTSDTAQEEQARIVRVKWFLVCLFLAGVSRGACCASRVGGECTYPKWSVGMQKGSKLDLDANLSL